MIGKTNASSGGGKMSKITIDGTLFRGTLDVKTLGKKWMTFDNQLCENVYLPYSFYQGSAVIYNGEIHILGGGDNSGNYTKHYKWNGSTWTSVSTLPYNFYQGSAVIYNGEIHILGGGGGSTKHYKWNGSTWTSVSTLPYNFQYGSAVIYNGEIHILGSDNSINYTKHYKWNGSTWISVSTLPYDFYRGSAVIYNGEIHIMGSYSSSSNAAKYITIYKLTIDEVF